MSLVAAHARGDRASATLDHHLAGRRGAAPASSTPSSTSGPADAEREAGDDVPARCRLPSQMSAGTWRNVAQGSAITTSRDQPGKITSGTVSPLKKTPARTPSVVGARSRRAARRRWGDEEADPEAHQHRERDRWQRTPSHAAGLSGKWMSNSSAPTMVGATPRVSRWYAARPRSWATYQPIRRHRPVEVDGDVTGADPVGQVGGRAAAPHHHGHDHRLAEPDVGDRVGGRVAAGVRLLVPQRQVDVADDHAEDAVGEDAGQGGRRVGGVAPEGARRHRDVEGEHDAQILGRVSAGRCRGGSRGPPS